MSMNSDVLHEILLRVDPSCIFSFILVSKDFLQLITGTVFRRDYLSKWNLPLGFLMYITPSSRSSGRRTRFLATNKLGGIINERISKTCVNFTSKPEDYAGLALFIDDHEPLCQTDFQVFKPKEKDYAGPPLFSFNDRAKPLPQTAFYVGNIASNDQPLYLPPPPKLKRRKFYLANILSCEEGFKVILAKGDDAPRNRDRVKIQTLSSWTNKWDQAELTLSKKTRLKTSTPGHFIGRGIIDAGAMSSGGIVYWYADSGGVNGLAVYDTTNLNKVVNFIQGPVPSLVGKYAYGVSPEGSLRCATWKTMKYISEEGTWEMGTMMNIWSLGDDKKRWELLHALDVNHIRTENSAALAPLFENRPDKSFDFVSFVPRRSDFIHVRLGKEIFAYHLDTNKLERICHDSEGFDDHLVGKYHPMTMEELALWPSMNCMR